MNGGAMYDAVLESILDWAAARGYRQGDNPAHQFFSIFPGRFARQTLQSTKIHGDDNESDNGASKRERKNITHVMSGNTTSRFNGALDYRRWW